MDARDDPPGIANPPPVPGRMGIQVAIAAGPLQIPGRMPKVDSDARDPSGPIAAGLLVAGRIGHFSGWSLAGNSLPGADARDPSCMIAIAAASGLLPGCIDHLWLLAGNSLPGTDARNPLGIANLLLLLDHMGRSCG